MGVCNSRIHVNTRKMKLGRSNTLRSISFHLCDAFNTIITLISHVYRRLISFATQSNVGEILVKCDC